MWTRSPLPQPPAARSEAISASLFAAGATPETSWLKNIGRSKNGPLVPSPGPVGPPGPSLPPHAARTTETQTARIARHPARFLAAKVVVHAALRVRQLDR